MQSRSTHKGVIIIIQSHQTELRVYGVDIITCWHAFKFQTFTICLSGLRWERERKELYGKIQVNYRQIEHQPRNATFKIEKCVHAHGNSIWTVHRVAVVNDGSFFIFKTISKN